MPASGAQRAVARFRTRITTNPSLDRHSGVRKAPRDPPGTPPLIGEVYMTAVSRRSFLLTGGTAAAAGAVLTGAGVTLLSPAARAATAATSTPVLAGTVLAGTVLAGTVLAGLAAGAMLRRGRPDLHGARHHPRLRRHHRGGRRPRRPGREPPHNDRQRRGDRPEARRDQRREHRVRPWDMARRHRAQRDHRGRRPVAAAHLPVPPGHLRGRDRPCPRVLRARRRGRRRRRPSTTASSSRSPATARGR